MLSVGQVLDSRYEVLAPLAEGGMGAVYRARRTLLGDEVAIKIIRADHTGPAAIERFLRESRACAQLRHPNIVSIFDFNADDPGRPFLVMELLSGPSLKDTLALKGALPLDALRVIVPPICSALALAHGRGIVHRDLKPANIVAHEFLPGQIVYKIVDFGLANIRESTDVTRLTDAHQFVGTVAYASPEQLSGAAVDSRSDVYSLGAVIFELVTGRMPFPGADPLSILTGHLSRPAPVPSSLRPDLPAWVDEVVGRALAKSPDDRWADIGEMGRLIAGTSSSGATTAGGSAGGGTSSLLDTYELGERIGPGRLGSDVYRGVHRALRHPVAIRVLRGAGPRNAAVRARFLREARTLQIVHPSVIHVRDYGEEPDLVYLVTDHIEGASLREVLNHVGALPWDRLCRLVSHLLQAARVLHRRKGLLCGLTPEIIRVTADDDGERLMISTAGIWQAQDLLSTLQEQTVRGTGLADAELRYVAPELLTGQAADVRSDVFTIGVLTYEMATGTLPYDAASMPALLGAMLRGAPRDPRDAQPSLPAGAAAALLRALHPDPGERFPTAREFGAGFGVGS